MHSALEQFLDRLVIDSDTLCRLTLELAKLYPHLALTSSDQFLATPINVLPSGSETGLVLAIDVGGTNLRVGFVELSGSSKLKRSYDKTWPIEDHLKTDKARDFFNWIGDCIAEVVSDRCNDKHPDSDSPSHPLRDVIPLGIAWSFPLIQSSISTATISKMGKGFAIPDNQNLDDLILEGYSRHLSPDGPSGTALPRIKIAAICNDTLATFASLAYTAGSTQDKHVSMGLIVGTGTNAAIPMKLSGLHKNKCDKMTLPADTGDNDDTVIVNTEWSINGTAPPLHDLRLITVWDEIIDRESTGQPGFMPFEYMAGGRFFGELVRLIVLRYFVSTLNVEELWLPENLRKRQGLGTMLLSTILAPDMAMQDLIQILADALPPPSGSTWSWTPENAEILQDVARAVSLRSANMVAAAVVAALASNGEFALYDPALAGQRRSSTARAQANNERIVAYTGGIITEFPQYREHCQTAIDWLVQRLSPPGIEQHIILSEAPNGSVIGAGVLAGTVCNIPEQHRAD